jgi:Rab-GTPase-TBC domain
VQETRVPGSRYDTLLQVTVGQEEVEDVIFRDIHRTFPQHPRFVLGQGQEELFNVLKAYSMIDMEARAANT